jgi:hypothetical protein
MRHIWIEPYGGATSTTTIKATALWAAVTFDWGRGDSWEQHTLCAFLRLDYFGLESLTQRHDNLVLFGAFGLMARIMLECPVGFLSRRDSATMTAAQ